MRFGNFSVMVPEGTERDSGYVEVEHGRPYTIRLLSHVHRQADAEVSIDAKPIGTFRLKPHGCATIERKVDDHGRFTFYADNTAEAAAVGADVPALNRGLIQVRFVPEVQRPDPPAVVRSMGFAGAEKTGGGLLRSASLGARPMGLTGGVTGLSGRSDQQFVGAGPIERSESEAVTITLRLVAASPAARPLTPVRQGNEVPAPV